jgi:hypothetical protein
MTCTVSPDGKEESQRRLAEDPRGHRQYEELIKSSKDDINQLERSSKE